jgi:hypothetical protein
VKISGSIAFVMMALIAIPFISGCGGGYTGNAQLAPCEGTVTLDDKPLADATVTMTNSQASSTAQTDASGKFSMMTIQGPKGYPGAPIGTLQVSIMKNEGGGGADMGPEPDASDKAAHDEWSKKYMEAMKAANETPKSAIPTKYTSPSTSGISLELPKEGKKDVAIKLTSS